MSKMPKKLMVMLIFFKCARDIFQKVCRLNQSKAGKDMCTHYSVRIRVVFFCLLQAGESLVSLGERASRQLTLSLSQSIHLQTQWYRVNAGHQ